MARRRIRTRSGQQLDTLGTRALTEYRRRAGRAGDEAMMELHAAAIETVSQPGKGRVYDKEIRMIGGRPRILRTKQHPEGVPRPRHQASAPGDPPARDTGTGARSIGWARKGPLKWIFGSGSLVMLWMERGTRTVLPRPWVWASIRRALPRMRAAIRRRLRDG
jgi:hypothetical protein